MLVKLQHLPYIPEVQGPMSVPLDNIYLYKLNTILWRERLILRAEEYRTSPTSER